MLWNQGNIKSHIYVYNLRVIGSRDYSYVSYMSCHNHTLAYLLTSSFRVTENNYMHKRFCLGTYCYTFNFI